MNDLVNELFSELRNVALFEDKQPKLELKDIPMRVIVTKILPFFELSFKKEKIREFDLFGTFSRDKTRKVFFIFSSLYISYLPRSCVIDFGRLRSLSLKTPSKALLSNLIFVSPDLRNLENLTISDIRSDRENNVVGKNSYIAKLFSISGGFPNLFHFSLNQDELHRTGDIDVSNWSSNNSRIWNQIRSLSITSSRDERPFFPIFFASLIQEVDTFSEIVSLDLRFLVFTKQQLQHKKIRHKKVVLKTPNVRRISLVSCSGFQIEPGNQIQYLFLGNIDIELTQYLYSLSPNLLELEIDGGGEDTDSSCSWLFDENNYYTHVSNLNFLRSLTLENMNWTNKNEEDDFDEFREELSEYISFENYNKKNEGKAEVMLNYYLNENLSVFEIRGISNFPLNILTDKKRPLKLKEIVLNIESVSELPFSPIFHFSKYLTRMELIEVYSITDVFFERNEWKSLEHLSLFCDDFSYISGKWNQMPKLNKLHISNCKWLTDRFFEHMQFTKLEVLSIGLCDGFKGRSGWESFSTNLKKLSLTNCQNITDEVFKGKSFGKCLETLVLTGLPEIHGLGWARTMSRKLVKFEILFCVRFQDAFLVENDFENLRDIKVVDCGFVKGVNWGKMKQLRRVTARNYFLEILKENEGIIQNETKLKPFYI